LFLYLATILLSSSFPLFEKEGLGEISGVANGFYVSQENPLNPPLPKGALLHRNTASSMTSRN